MCMSQYTLHVFPPVQFLGVRHVWIDSINCFEFQGGQERVIKNCVCLVRVEDVSEGDGKPRLDKPTSLVRNFGLQE
jgi:hypothetical protein